MMQRYLFLFSVLVLFSACGEGVGTSVTPTKPTLRPGETERLTVDIEQSGSNPNRAGYAFRWSIVTPNCGDFLGRTNAQSVHWIAPTGVTSIRMCAISVRVRLFDRGGSTLDESTFTFDRKVDPTLQSENIPFKVGEISFPSGDIFTDNPVTLEVEVTNPERLRLQYKWETSSMGGRIVGSSLSVAWVPPETPGSYVIRVFVSYEGATIGRSVQLTIKQGL